MFCGGVKALATTISELSLYDTNNDGVVDDNDLDSMFEEMTLDPIKSKYHMTDMVALKRYIMTDLAKPVYDCSTFKVTEQNTWFILNNVCSDDYSGVTVEDNKTVSIGCTSGYLTFDCLEVIPKNIKGTVVANITAPNSSESYTIWHDTISYHIGISLIDISKLSHDGDTNFVVNSLCNSEVTNSIVEENDDYLIIEQTSANSVLQLKFDYICDVEDSEKFFVFTIDKKYIIYIGEDGHFYISH